MKETNLEFEAHRFALAMQRMTGEHMCHYLPVARAAVALIREMEKGVTVFSYMGQDGILHKVKGTLTDYETCFKRPYRMNPGNRFILYYNTKLKAWRTFHAIGLVSVMLKSVLNEPKSKELVTVNRKSIWQER